MYGPTFSSCQCQYRASKCSRTPPRTNHGLLKSHTQLRLQLHTIAPGDTAATALAINGRGDDMGCFRSTTAPIWLPRQAQRRRIQLHVLHATTGTNPVLAAEETTDSTATDSTALATAAQENDSEQTSSSTSNPEESEASTKKNTWVTDDTPEPGTVKGYSIIVGGFVERNLAENFLNDISNDWAPKLLVALQRQILRGPQHAQEPNGSQCSKSLYQRKATAPGS